MPVKSRKTYDSGRPSWSGSPGWLLASHSNWRTHDVVPEHIRLDVEQHRLFIVVQLFCSISA